MAFKALPNGAKVVSSFLVNGHPWTNTMWFTKSGFDSTALAELTAVVDEFWGGAMLPLLSDDGSYVRSKGYDMRTVDGGTVVVTTSTGPGEGAGDALPAGSALCITLYTAGRGRSSRGRLYVGGIDEGDWAGGVYEEANSNAIKAILDLMLVEAATAGWTPVVASGQQDGVVLTEMVGRPITVAIIRSRVAASQRRRNQRP